MELTVPLTVMAIHENVSRKDTHTVKWVNKDISGNISLFSCNFVTLLCIHIIVIQQVGRVTTVTKTLMNAAPILFVATELALTLKAVFIVLALRLSTV